MAVHELFKPRDALHGLIALSVNLARHSKEVSTMKNYLRCYDILDMTDRINTPWESHPGVVYGDIGAFVDLELTCKDIVRKLDPSPHSVKEYVLSMTRFLIFWKRAAENRAAARVLTLLR